VPEVVGETSGKIGRILPGRGPERVAPPGLHVLRIHLFGRLGSSGCGGGGGR
jgi:hypothetical protein